MPDREPSFEWDADNYCNLLWHAKSFIRHSAVLYVESYDESDDAKREKLREQAFKAFIDAQSYGNRAHAAAYGKKCPFLGPQLDEEIERISPHDKI